MKAAENGHTEAVKLLLTVSNLEMNTQNQVRIQNTYTR